MAISTLDTDRNTRSRSADRPRRVLIVGAGPGGLAAALLLRHAGLEVRVIERMPHVGGRTSAIQADGFRFDLGPTFFLYPVVLERIFRRIGRRLDQEIPMVKLDPQYRVIFGDRGDLVCTPNVEQMEAAIAKLAPNDAPNLRRFLAENRDKLSRFRPALESPFLSWRRLLSWDLMKLLPILRPWNSVDDDLQRYFADERIRLAFSFQSKYLGMSPFNCPSLFSILSFLEYEFGVWHPIGGCSAVSDAMARVAREMGVEFHLDEPVREVLLDGRKAVGVRTDAGEYRADAVVMNADFAQAMKKLIPNVKRRRWTDEKLAKKRYSCSTYMLYLGIEGLEKHLHHHTIYTSNDYLSNLADIESNHRLSDDPSVYVQNACITDTTLAPKGKSTLYVLSPVTHQHENVDWKKEAPAFRERILRQLETKFGVADLSKRILFEREVTPADWEHGYEIYRGATFNLAHNLGQMLHMRPQNRFEDLDKVYLVGGGTHPGSGLPVIYESARITSRLLLQDFGLDTDWLEETEVVASSMPVSPVSH
ncbi:phytoene desaturase family protein [Tuwongella immobilis]|uniref:Amine oxidase domain-containing protein n=1 Tax=Tuwongella immobilis TaxID=692036 RepID=A0A6C2YRS4_9BACT|nr:phytoene desaturase family protein [Tuwongella immobilis]VIP03823.1 phytoene desaturase : Phytoene desaturase OS=Candidatus Entotheonella sp. TSY1 GN=ETSY1_19775 PE=4 SV=1: Amino_oxidase [Tuwongella immobilis]VTS05013.1 phytoene desaturase : Phytoene desaturase OS=Candidatus Entotheonella sp. TSY1 GN=ETSY1_19775 PE=4 SV=1: Amino_oxidase [Tuwongella immobilis]